MKLYVPSWNGDFRIESVNPDRCRLVVHKPTPFELELMGKLLVTAREKKWTDAGEPPSGKWFKKSLELGASVGEVGKVLMALTRPAERTLTAVKFSGGKLEIVEGATPGALEKVAEAVKEAEKTETKAEPAAAVAVKRHTICCPACVPGAVGPASEVLLSFLTPQQHEDWSKTRTIVVTGGKSGHRYILAHRNTPLAAKLGRICWDADDEGVLHFHDQSHPPEEEVLAAKLILEHREPWLRNEGSCFAGCRRGRFTDVYKNPFGDIRDGTKDAAVMQALGTYAQGLVTIADAGGISNGSYDPMTGFLGPLLE